jgi:hypothetical protein
VLLVRLAAARLTVEPAGESLRKNFLCRTKREAKSPIRKTHGHHSHSKKLHGLLGAVNLRSGDRSQFAARKAENLFSNTSSYVNKTRRVPATTNPPMSMEQAQASKPRIRP